VIKIITYLRNPFIHIGIALWTVICSYLVVIFSVLRLKWLSQVFVPRIWGKTLAALSFLDIKVEGLETLPEGGALYLFNHASHFDIPIIVSTMDRWIRFGAKIELFKVPFLSTSMRWLGVIPIERTSRKKVLSTYTKYYDKVAEGHNFILAPEGTRQTEPHIGRFKRGPFIFALAAKAPIVPIVIKGAIEALPKGSMVISKNRWRVPIYVKYLPPISVEGYSEDNMDELQERVHKAMEDAYNSLP